jgi:hypothetical protein
VGCNIALNRVPADARIEIIKTGRRRGDESLTEKSNERLLTSSPTIIVSPEEVREKFKRVKPLKDISVTQRGWTLDVLNIVRRITEEKHASVLDCGGKRSATPLSHRSHASSQSGVTAAALQNEFTTADAYAFTRELERLHPDNRHVRDKIRQQLQVLRDLGLLLHVERGIWRLP